MVKKVVFLICNILLPNTKRGQNQQKPELHLQTIRTWKKQRNLKRELSRSPKVLGTFVYRRHWSLGEMRRWSAGALERWDTPSPQCSNAPMPSYQHATHCGLKMDRTFEHLLNTSSQDSTPAALRAHIKA